MMDDIWFALILTAVMAVGLQLYQAVFGIEEDDNEGE